MHATEEKESSPIKQKLNNLDLEPIVEQLFEWMIDPKVKIAVKVFAGWALLNLRHCYPWIADELPAQLEFLMRDGTAAIQTAGRKMLEELKSSF
jgi:acetylornithine/succinyldiaminopimelate/putrescine aminotransferase